MASESQHFAAFRTASFHGLPGPVSAAAGARSEPTVLKWRGFLIPAESPGVLWIDCPDHSSSRFPRATTHTGSD